MSAERKKAESRFLLATDAAKLWGGALVEQLFALVRGVIMPRWLGPSFYGILGSLNMITKYGGYLQLGLTTAVSREVPYALGAGDHERANRIARTVFSFNLLTSVVPGAAVALFALLSWGRFRAVVSWGFLVFAFLLVSSRLDSFYTSLFRAKRQFNESFLFSGLKAAGMFGAVITLLYFRGIYGVYIALVATGVFFTVVGATWTRTWAGPWPRWSVVRELLPIGLPLAGLGVLGFALQSVDRLMVIRFMPGPPVGYYMLAVTIVTFIYFLPMNIGQAMAPRIYALRRDGAADAEFENYLVKPSLVLTYAVASVGGVAVLCLIPFIRYALPAYTPTVPLVAAMLVGITCQGGAQGAGHILVALGRFRMLAFAQAAGLIVAFGLVVAAILARWGLLGVAIGSSVGLVSFACIIQFAAWRAMALPARTIPNAFGYLLVPPAAVAAALIFAFYVGSYVVLPVVRGWGKPGMDIGLLAARLVFFAPLVVLLGFYVERQTNVVARLRAALRERFSP